MRLVAIDASPAIVPLLDTALRTDDRAVSIVRVETALALESALAHEPIDVVTCDASTPSLDAGVALGIVQASGRDIPFVLVAGAIGEERVADLLRAGASDFVHKDRLARLGPVVTRELRDVAARRGDPAASPLDEPHEWHRVERLREPTDPHARRRTAEALRISEARFLSLWRSDILLLTIVGWGGVIIDVNRGFTRVLGYSREDMLARKFTWADLTPAEWYAADAVAREELLRTGSARPWEREVVARDGHRVPILSSVVMLDGEVGVAIALAIDLTERKRVDRALMDRMRAAAATAAVGIALTKGDSLETMLPGCAVALAVRLGATTVRIWAERGERDVLELIASIGPQREGIATRVPISEMLKLRARMALEHEAHLVFLHAPGEADEAWAASQGLAGFAGYLLADGERVVGFVTLFTRDPLSDEIIEGLRMAADAIALGIRRVRAEAAKDSLEAQLRQSQKLEAIGSLAGGIAHDFNNLLSVIISCAAFMKSDLEPDHPLHEDVAEIDAAAHRAAALTRQLLAFSRQQVLQPRVLDLNVVVRDLESMLRRLLPEDIDLRVVADAGIGHVSADPGQLEQLLMNLVVNARDAIEQTGTVTIETARVDLDDAFVRAHDGATAGPHVEVSVTDTGSGMTDAVRARIFEPFFTTKPKGQGTGLGLSTVFGIVKQSGGALDVISEPGRGTSFRIYLPSVEARVRSAAPPPSVIDTRGSETILLCEDEAAVRSLVRQVLVRNGYRVLDAPDGREALVLAEQHPAIDLLLTDVVMPVMSGRELAEELLARRPGLKVLFMSGYTDDIIVRHGLAQEGVVFLQKPFTPDVVARKVREALDSPTSAR